MQPGGIPGAAFFFLLRYMGLGVTDRKQILRLTDDRKTKTGR
jgi:hypothetical protein